MSDKLSTCVLATTHVDKHGDRLTKEALEELASHRPDLIYWDHQTTLLPVAVAVEYSVEPTHDGEYALVVTTYAFRPENSERLDESGLEDQIKLHGFRNCVAHPTFPHGFHVSYDPRNFKQEQIRALMEDLDQLEGRDTFSVSCDELTRKAEFPKEVLWILMELSFLSFAKGFLGHFGKVAAEKLLDRGKAFFRNLGQTVERHVAQLDNQPDLVLPIVISDFPDIRIEAAIEKNSSVSIADVYQDLPLLCGIIWTLVENNGRDAFSHMKFLYNPQARQWEVNYLVRSKTQNLILGPRYYDEEHPLHPRYRAVMDEIARARKQPLGMSIGVPKNLYNSNDK